MPVWLLAEEVFRLQIAYLLVVKRDVEVWFTLTDESVVGKDFYSFSVRRLDNLGGGNAILRDDDEDIYALRNHVFRLFVLSSFVAISGLHDNFRAEFFRFSLENVPVLLPPFHSQ